mmetsp:Transcript_13203/g.39914  ORF Transcript_13203/g.39914 Transcript_13203/m.39914 type:complete len:205 (-) Transcript_13203:836-1450(-)
MAFRRVEDTAKVASCSDPRFAQQFDEEVIVPDAVARPLVFSSQLFLGVAIASAARRFWGIFACSLTVWVTSTNFWRAPRFSSWRRPADWLAVMATFVYASVLASTRVVNGAWTAVWFVGLAVLLVCFTVNESLCNFRLGTLPSGSYGYAFWSRSLGLKPTDVGTIERHRALQANVWRHFCCVHVWGATLAFLLILAGLQRRQEV